ncbi:MAG: DUF3530 family protein, partial [Gammaproteobacteria bacterium]
MNAQSFIIKPLLIILLTCLAASASASSKSDRAKERRWENQIVDSLMVGDAVKLKADNVEFLALYAEPTTDKAKGAVIILHGIGAHPAWPDVIEPIRMQLPDHGWYTLSLQMPVLGNEATDKDYPPLFPEVSGRIQAGVDFLKSHGINNIVISGHSLGTTMASCYLAKHRDPAVKVFASISGGFGVPNDKLMDNNRNFTHMQGVRILDIYGVDDRNPVLNAVKARAKLMSKIHNANYRQI